MRIDVRPRRSIAQRAGDAARARVGRPRFETDITRVLRYRPELFGSALLALERAALHGPSEWSRGERELFATFVAHCNRCQFCAVAHAASARHALRDESLVDRVLVDSQSAPVNAKVRATLAMLEGMAHAPAQFGSSHLLVMRQAGVSRAAIEDAIAIGVLMNVIVRVANALDFEIPSGEYLEKRASAQPPGG